jgi:sirohydrochlorin ferrochelatase
MVPSAALIVMDHGSRRPSAHQELEVLVSKLRLDRPNWLIEGAHLELADPRFPVVLENVIKQVPPSCQIYVLPWFLASGRHLNEDVPELIEAARAKHPDYRINLTSHLGDSEVLRQIAWSHVEGIGES